MWLTAALITAAFSICGMNFTQIYSSDGMSFKKVII